MTPPWSDLPLFAPRPDLEVVDARCAGSTMEVEGRSYRMFGRNAAAHWIAVPVDAPDARTDLGPRVGFLHKWAEYVRPPESSDPFSTPTP